MASLSDRRVGGLKSGFQRQEWCMGGVPYFASMENTKRVGIEIEFGPNRRFDLGFYRATTDIERRRRRGRGRTRRSRRRRKRINDIPSH